MRSVAGSRQVRKCFSTSGNSPSQDFLSAVSSAKQPPPFSSACPEATQPSATSIPGVATATRAPSTDGAFRRSSGPMAAVPLLVPISVSAAVPLSVAVSSSPGSADRRAAFLLPYLQPLFLLLLALLLLLLFLLLVPSFALLLPLCAVQKPLYRLVDTTVS